MMKRLMVLILVCSMLVMTAAMAENVIFTYRFADAEEAATLLLSNRTYYENLNQMDLDFRMQKKGATLEELEAFVPTQMLDFTDEEKQAIDEGMNLIENVCRNQGYVLPKTDGIVFVKTTMHEESDAGAYTHGTQIYLGERLMNFGISAVPEEKEAFQVILAHELFHCLTRNHPDFRKDMYEIL